MKRFCTILMTLGLALAVASPALAEFKLNGYYRLQGYSWQAKSTTRSSAQTKTLIDQRLRMKLTYSLNDAVSIVHYSEIDTPWGDTTRGGGLGADKVNIETKNVYLNWKLNGGNLALGVQGAADPVEGVVYNDDMAALQYNRTTGTLTINALYSKWDEGSKVEKSTIDNYTIDHDPADAAPAAILSQDLITLTANTTTTTTPGGQEYWDDTDFYALNLVNKFSDAFKLGAHVYFLDGNATEDKTFWYGVSADARAGVVAVNGFALCQTFDNDSAGTTVDNGTALAASVKFNALLDGGQIGLRAIYFSEDDSREEDQRWKGSAGAFEFVNENLTFFLADVYVNNSSGGAKNRYAFVDAVAPGYGLLGVTLSGKFNLPSSMYTKFGAGYFRANDDDINEDVATKKAGKTLGYEAAAQVGKVFNEKVDVSLRGAYAHFGSFYDNTVNGNDEPDDVYQAVAMVNVSF